MMTYQEIEAQIERVKQNRNFFNDGAYEILQHMAVRLQLLLDKTIASNDILFDVAIVSEARNDMYELTDELKEEAKKGLTDLISNLFGGVLSDLEDKLAYAEDTL